MDGRLVDEGGMAKASQSLRWAWERNDCPFLKVKSELLSSALLARPVGMDGHRGPHHPLLCVPSCQARFLLSAVGV